MTAPHSEGEGNTYIISSGRMGGLLVISLWKYVLKSSLAVNQLGEKYCIGLGAFNRMLKIFSAFPKIC